MFNDRFKKHPWLGIFGILIEGATLAFCFIPMGLIVQQTFVLLFLIIGFSFNVRDYLKVKNKINDDYTHYLAKFELGVCALLLAGIIPATVFSANLGVIAVLTIILLNILVMGYYTNQIWRQEKEALLYSNSSLTADAAPTNIPCVSSSRAPLPQESVATAQVEVVVADAPHPAAGVMLDNPSSAVPSF